jgi:hypothetical protein
MITIVPVGPSNKLISYYWKGGQKTIPISDLSKLSPEEAIVAAKQNANMKSIFTTLNLRNILGRGAFGII